MRKEGRCEYIDRQKKNRMLERPLTLSIRYSLPETALTRSPETSKPTPLMETEQ